MKSRMFYEVRDRAKFTIGCRFMAVTKVK